MYASARKLYFNVHSIFRYLVLMSPLLVEKFRSMSPNCPNDFQPDSVFLSANSTILNSKKLQYKGIVNTQFSFRFSILKTLKAILFAEMRARIKLLIFSKLVQNLNLQICHIISRCNSLKENTEKGQSSVVPEVANSRLLYDLPNNRKW